LPRRRGRRKRAGERSAAALSPETLGNPPHCIISPVLSCVRSATRYRVDPWGQNGQGRPKATAATASATTEARSCSGSSIWARPSQAGAGARRAGPPEARWSKYRGVRCTRTTAMSSPAEPGLGNGGATTIAGYGHGMRHGRGGEEAQLTAQAHDGLSMIGGAERGRDRRRRPRRPKMGNEGGRRLHSFPASPEITRGRGGPRRVHWTSRGGKRAPVAASEHGARRRRRSAEMGKKAPSEGERENGEEDQGEGTGRPYPLGLPAPVPWQQRRRRRARRSRRRRQRGGSRWGQVRWAGPARPSRQVSLAPLFLFLFFF
jgi:hypothetical protein